MVENILPVIFELYIYIDNMTFDMTANLEFTTRGLNILCRFYFYVPLSSTGT